MYLSFNNVNKTIGKRKILDNLNFEIKQNEVFGIIGNNGAGKSTLLKTISTITNFEGDITLNGKKISPENIEFKKQLGILIEQPAFYNEMTGLEFLKVSMKYKGVNLKFLEQKILPFKFAEFQEKKIKHYSQGMKQKLGILIATINCPDVIILDEPHNSLDPSSIIEIREYILNLKQQGSTIIISSHSISEVIKICDTVMILDNGKLKTLICREDFEKIELNVV